MENKDKIPTERIELLDDKLNGIFDNLNTITNQLVEIGNSITELSNRRYITETWNEGTSWYRVWSDGWIEQGGSRGSCATDNYITVTFPKTFKNTNYCFVETTKASGNAGSNVRSGVMILSMTESNIKLEQDSYADAGGLWYACGY